MNVDGVITSVANQLVEILKVPVEMAWKAGIEYTRLKGMINISTYAFGILVFLIMSYFLWFVIFQKVKEYKKEEDNDYELAYLAGIFLNMVIGMISSGIAGLSNNLIINIFMVLYPESMMIYNIIEKVL